MNKSKLLITIGLSVLVTAGTPNINATTIGYTKELVGVFDDDQNGNTKEIDESIDVNNHEEIIHTDVNTILELLGYEKGIEVMRQHFLEEINMYRIKNNISTLDLDSILNEAAQKFAEYGSKYEGLCHSLDDKSVRDMGVDLSDLNQWGENVAYGQNTIFDVVEARYYKSAGHKKTMLGLHKSEYTGEFMSYNSLGIGVDGDFFVAEFGTK